MLPAKYQPASMFVMPDEIGCNYCCSNWLKVNANRSSFIPDRILWFVESKDFSVKKVGPSISV